MIGRKLLQVLIFSGLLGPAALRAEAPPLDFFSGRYEAVGRFPGSRRTYQGTVEMTVRGDHLRWTRTVGDRRWKGDARIEPSLCDGVPVLRVTFEDRGTDREILYLMHSDLDNYPRLTGQVYRRDRADEKVGLEALYSAHE